MYDITIDEKVLIMWRNHTKEVLDMVIYRAKIMPEEAYDATWERPNASLVASFDNILAIFIITFQTSFV
jgi:hypothetical protein